MPENQADDKNEASGDPSAFLDVPAQSEQQRVASQVPPSGSPIEQEPQAGFLRRFFWLDERIAKATTAGWGIDPAGFAEFEVVREVQRGVTLLDHLGEGNSAILVLERAQVLLLIRALMKRQGMDLRSLHLDEDDWKLAAQVDTIRGLVTDMSGNELSALKACLGRDAESFLVGADAKRLRHLARGLRRAAHELMVPVERDDHEISRLLLLRWARLGSAVALALGLLAFGVLSLESRRHKPNIALHRPVKVSSQAPNTGAAEGQLVDGITNNLGFHTENETNPFAVIDLGKTQTISKVVVYNRDDCCQERAVPLSIEVSDDAVSFRPIAERRELFDKWTVSGLNAKARYVRLRLMGTNIFHLSEVEVY